MVKKLHFLTMLSIVVSVLLAGCSDDDDRIKTTTGSCVFKAAGGEAVVVVASDPAAWGAEITGDGMNHFTWTSDGDEITVKAPANTTGGEITATLVISAGHSTANVKLTQEPAGTASFVFTPDVEQYEFMSLAGSYKIRVDGPGDWEAASDREWLEAYKDETGLYLVLKAGDNNDPERLNANATVSLNGQKVRTIAVTQQIKNDNPYYALLGKWEIHCDEWYYGGEFLGAGTYSDVYFTELEPNHRILMSKFFFEGAGLVPGTRQEVIYDYDSENGISLKIPIGLPVWAYSSFVDYFAFTNVKADPRTFVGGQMEAIISADNNRMSFFGIPEGFGIGLLSFSSVNGFRFYEDMYYAASSNIEFRKVEGQYNGGVPVPAQGKVNPGAPDKLGSVPEGADGVAAVKSIK